METAFEGFQISLDIDGHPVEFDRIHRVLEERVGDAIFAAGNLLAQDMREQPNVWPIDTGKSKRGFFAVPSEDGFEIRNREEYAKYVERRGSYIQRRWYFYEQRYFDEALAYWSTE